MIICFIQATPKLSEDKVKQCVDPRLGSDYPPKAVAKVILGLLDSFYWLVFRLIKWANLELSFPHFFNPDGRCSRAMCAV